MRTSLLLIIFAATQSISRALPVYEIIADFERPPDSPLAPLVLASDGNFYGTTSAGGRNNFGAVFKMTSQGAVTELVHFTGATGEAKGSAPLGGLTPGADGALYGTTSAGGAGELGTLFKVTTAGAFTTLVQFTGTAGAAKGAVPAGELLLAADGNFYGTTEAGGVDDLGTIFKMTPAGVLTTIREFTGIVGPTKGAQPRGQLAIDVAGSTLFGVCARGGANDVGTVFKMTLGGVFTSLKEFTGVSGSAKGELPAGGLVRGSDGNYYGVTEAGGANDLGSIFRITPSGSLTTLHHGGAPDGGGYAGALFQAADGNFYGVAANGGSNDLGTIFQITPDGVYTVLAQFAGDEGAAPRAALVAGPDGTLHGPASAGGSGQRGTLFKVTTTGVFTALARFTNAEGWSPTGGLTIAADGSLLGTFTEGGTGGWGAVSKITPSGVVTPLVSFTGIAGTARGAEPVGALIPNAGGDFYGITRRGGTSNGGTAFILGASGLFTTLTAFGSATGQFPEDGLAVSSDGFFYAAASEGGATGLGSIFKMDGSGTRTLLVSFTGTAGVAPGTHPIGALASGDNGKFFGTTAEGGMSDKGTIFCITGAGVLTPLVEFAGADGATPLGALARGPDGNFYGTTSAGGGANFGTVFRLTPAGARTTLAEFTGATGSARGSAPVGTLLVAPDGALYGTTSAGGANGFGTVFRVSSAGTLTTLFDFTGLSAPNPGAGGPGALVFGNDGLLYGSTPDGGARGGGVVFRIGQQGPHAGTRPANAVTTTGATLEALVFTGGEPTTVSFEYGATPALGAVTAEQSIDPGPAARVSENLTGLTSGQLIFYRAKAVNGSGSSFGFTRSFTVPAAFSAWKLAAVGDANAPDLADPDGDGLTLLHEYAFSLSPLVPDATAQPAPGIRTYVDGERLALFFTRDPTHNDVTIEVQAAGDVTGPWTTVATSVNGAPTSGPGYFGGETPGASLKTIEARDIVNVDATPQRFLRIRLSH